MRYEKRTSTGRVDSDAFAVDCAEFAELKPGVCGGSLQLWLKSGAKVDVDRATKQQLTKIQAALAKACGPR